MKKIYLLLITVAIAATAWSQTTRQWIGPTASSWLTPGNWATVPGGTPGVPVTGDIVVFNDGTNKTIINVPAITLGGLIVENTTGVVLANGSSNNNVTISNGPGAIDFKVDAGSTLDLSAASNPSGVNILLDIDETVVAFIAGTFVINAGRAYEADFNGVTTSVTGTIQNRGLVTGTETRLLFLAGSNYIHDLDEGDIPDATWDPTSTCKITGSVFNGPRFLNRPFGNFIWDCPGQKRMAKLAASGMSVAGTFSIVNTGESRVEMDQQNLTVGNFDLSGGTFKIASDSVNFFGNPIIFPQSRTLEVAGNVSISGGNLLMSTVPFLADIGTLNVKGNFSQTGGTIYETGAGRGSVNFSGIVVQTFSKTPAAVISNTIDFTIANNAKVDFGTSILNGSEGTFTLSNNAKIITSHANGLGITGTIQVTGTKTFSTGADYEFRGASTGSFFTSGSQVRDLIIDNTTTGQVIPGRTFLVNRTLILTNGYLTTAPGQVIVNTDGTATSANGAFVNGPLSKRTNSTTAFTFPVGKVVGGLHTIGVKPTSTTSSTFVAQYFRAAAPTATLGAGLAALSACEYWDLARTAGTSPAAAILSWSSTSPCNGAGYVTSLADLRVAHLTGGLWQSEGNASVTGNPTAGTVTSNAVTTFSPFALASSSAANPLPVVFADVKAYEKNNGVQIEWSNLTEKDVAEYTIERSANGRDFSAIGSQLPTSNQNDKASYSGFDASPAQATNYYRIKAEETTGKIVYSKILSVSLGKSNAGLRLYPNPVSGNQVTISLNNIKKGQYNLRVVNTLGQDIFKQTIVNQSNSMTQTLDLPSVKPGVYNLVITGDGYRETKTFVIQ